MSAAVADGADDGVPSPEELEAAFAAEAPIKPCPFCGAAGDVSEGEGGAFVECLGDECSAMGPDAEDRDTAVERWNRRAP